MTDLTPVEPSLSEAKRALLQRRLGGRASKPSTIARAPRDQPLELSFAQRRLWFLQQLEPHSTEYNIPTPLHLRGALNPAALTAALSGVVSRHEVLRTSFPAEEGVPVQLVHEPEGISLEMIDLTDHSDPWSQAERIIAEDGALAFDLAAGPPLRARLLKLAENDHVLALNMHHIVFDEWSAGLLRHEIAALYDAFSRGRPARLPGLDVQYADYAFWQHESLRGKPLRALLDYWTAQLSDLPLLDMPTDRPRPVVRAPGNAATACFTIDDKTCRRLRQLSKSAGATMFMTMLAAFQGLLARYSSQNDFAVGTPVAGRTHPATESLIGFFVNTLVIRARLEGDPSFADLLARVRSTCLEAFAHQDLPFEQLVDRLAPVRDRSRHPLFDVIFNYADLRAAADAGRRHHPGPAGLRVEMFPACDAVAKFDLRMDVTEHTDLISGVLEYSTDLYDAAAMAQMARHFARLVEQLAADPDRPLTRLNLLDEDDRQLLIQDVNSTYSPSDRRSVHELFAEQAVSRAETAAVVAEDGHLTHAQLNRAANRLAHHLGHLGAGPDTVVAICLDRTCALVVAILGVLKAGAAYMIVELSDPLQRQASQLASAAVPVIVTTSAMLDALPDNPALTVCLDSDPLDRYPDTDPQVTPHPDQLAYVVFTSGSTGHPKGVGVTHRNLTTYTSAVTRRLDVRPGAAHAIAYRLAFDFPNTTFYTCLTTGGTLHLLPPGSANDPGLFEAYLRDHPIDYLKLLPTHLASLAGASGDAAALLPRSGLVLGGESSPHDWTASLATRSVAVHNHYGPSETTVGATTYRVVPHPDEASAATPAGRPLANSKVYVLDLSLCPAPAGVAGEVFIGGAGVARGYLDRPELTADRFIPDPFANDGSRLYRTGDAARWRRDGILEFLGRLDHQIKLRGHRVEPSEIEAALAACSGVGAAAVAIRQQRLVAYLIPTAPERDLPDAERLRDRLREILPEYMIPWAFVPLDSLPRTRGGKLDRSALPDPDLPTGQIDPIQLRNETERKLAGIYAEVLGLRAVGADDDFFDLGGHSLLATRAVARARMTFGVDLPVAALFDHPTVAALARVIHTLGAESRPPLRPRSRNLPLALSFAQQRLWFLNQLEPQSAEYNIPTAVRLRGHLDRHALAAGLSRLVARHEVLRTTFPAVGGAPYQRIHTARPVDLPVVDVTSHPDPQAETQRLLDKEARGPFDLESGTLLRALLIVTGDDEHVLALTVHHIVSDGWSAGILRRELAALYTAEIAGEHAHLPEPQVHYADYAAWQRDWLRGEVLERQLDYWREHLTDLPVLDIPTDRPRPPARDPTRAAAVSFTIDPSVTRRLRTLARAHDSTMFMTVLAAFQALLAAHSGQDDVVVGTPVAGRTHPATEDLIGLFVNTLVIRARPVNDPTFIELLRGARATCLDAYTHQDLPFERLVDELTPARDRGRHPLFDVLFTYGEAAGDGADDLRLPGIEACHLPACPIVAKFDLDLAVSEADDQLFGSFVYSTQLFDEETIQQLAKHFTRLLDHVSDNPARPVAELDLLTTAERRQQLADFNPASTPVPDVPIHEAFAREAANAPGKAAVLAHDGELSYARLDAASSRLAGHLRAAGVRRDTPVGVHLHRGVRLPIAILAILKAGGAYLPLDPVNPPARLAAMLAASGASIVITTRDLRDNIAADDHDPAGPDVVLVDDTGPVHEYHVGPPSTDTHPDQAAYVIFTSGSTGAPKGVVIGHRALTNRLTWMIEGGLLRREDRVAHKTPIGFDVSVWELLGTFACGATLVVARPDGHRDPSYLARLFAENGVTLAHFVPSMLPAITEQPALERCKALDRIICSGEPLTADRLRRFRHKHTAAVHNLYGPTEAAIDVTWWPCHGEASTVPIGTPTPNTRLHVLGPRLRPLPIGVPGELFIAGSQLARGYVGRPDQTAERFIPDPADHGGRLYRTGDLARWRRDGSLEFLGRTDQQLKVRGQRVEPAEIQAALADHPSVHTAVITTTRSGGQLVAYLVGDASDERPDAAELRTYLRARLPDHMIPAHYAWLSELPLTPNGKLDRAALPPHDPSADRADYVPPRTDVEQVLADAITDVLQLDRVGVHDNFFELGGDSIASIRVISRIRDAGLWLTPTQIFEHQTIAELATVVGEPTILAEQGTLSGDVPLTPIQRWFFELDRPDPHHFNQAIAFTVDARARAALFEAAAAAVVAQHDALRLRFIRRGETIVQRYGDEEPARWFDRVDLSGLDETAECARITAVATAAQRSLDLERGPLLRMVWLARGAGRSPYLLIVIHHLAVDALSWGILIEDLNRAYEQVEHGEQAQLGAKTTSYRQWATHLLENAESTSQQASQEAEYWLDHARRGCPKSLPVDHPDGVGSDDSRCTVHASLDAAETVELLRQVPKAYRAQVNDALLTALALAISRWSDDDMLLVDVEGHGRGEHDSVDLSRTVGWFTTYHPLLITVHQRRDLGRLLKSVKEQLRQVPSQGSGYGRLRYLGDERTRSRLAGLPRPEVSFNYLGRREVTLPSGQGLLRQIPHDIGPARSTRGMPTHGLDVVCEVTEDRLQVEIAYSDRIHHSATVEAVLDGFLTALRTLIAHCREAPTGGCTPSDFPLARLDQATLDGILTSVGGRSVRDIYPLSPMQQGMLHHSLLNPSSDVYIQQRVLTLNGRLDADVLSRAFAHVLTRHPALRASVAWDGPPRPLAVVLDEVQFPLERHDWRHLDTEARDRRLRSYLEDERGTPFVFGRDPLLRLALIRLGESSHYLVLTYHHLLLDGWSAPIVLDEVMASYHALAVGTRPRLPARRPYRDYIAWLQTLDRTANEAYWRAELAGFRTSTPLPAVTPSPRQGGGEHRASLSEEASSALTDFARAHHLTLATVIQGAWAILLARYADQTDVVFGSTVSGRGHPLPGIDDMIGMFINTVPVRAEVNRDEPVAGWLGHFQDRRLRAREHEHSPLTDIKTWSGLPSGESLFESLVIFENYPGPGSRPGAEPDEPGLLDSCTTLVVERDNYPLTVFVAPGRRVLIGIAYDRGRFDDDSAGRLAGHLIRLLEQIVAHPDRQLGVLDPLAPDERAHLVKVSYNSRGRADDHLVHEVVADRARAAPNQIAVISGDRRITYGQLDEEANRLSRRILALGVDHEAPVGVYLHRDIDLVTAFLGILKAGAAYLALDPAQPPARVAQMMADAHALIVITTSTLANLLPGDPPARILVDKPFSPQESPPAAPRIAIHPGQLAYLFFTSGSTGTPKCVAAPHQALSNLARAQQERFGLTAEDRVLQFNASGFDVSLSELLSALTAGATLIVAPAETRMEPASLLRLLRNEKVTAAQIPPAMLSELPNGELPDLALLLTGGEPVPAATFARWAPTRRFLLAYGVTEAGVTSTIAQCDAADQIPLPIGTPLDGTWLYLLDRHLNPAPAGGIGEIYIGGAGLARGYRSRPGLTADRFVPDPFLGDGSRLYRTGDRARSRPDGSLEFLGRVDAQVKLRGHRIEPAEVEAAVIALAGVRGAAVTVARDAGRDAQLVAYLVPEQEPVDGAEVRDQLRALLPDYMVPASYVWLDTMPVTPNGKVDRAALPAPGGAGPTASTPPRNPVEQVLANIFCEVLGIDSVGAHDDFFGLGGHSLLVTRVISRVRAAFDKDLPVVALFGHPTVSTLAEVLTDSAHEAAPQITPAPRDRRLPLSFAQQRLWFLHQLESERTGYNLPLALRLTGDLDHRVLTESLSETVARHAILRTRFPAVDGVAHQVIGPVGPVDLPIVDVSGEEDPAEAAGKRVSEFAGHVFDLAHEPPLRTLLIRLGPGEHVLALTMHHIGCDDWSARLLRHELTALYAAFSDDKPSPLAPLAVQYADYAAWQRELLAGDAPSQQLAYWREQLAGLQTLEMPTDRPRPRVHEPTHAATAAFTVPPSIRTRLDRVSRQQATTMFMTTLAAFQFLLSAYSGQDDIAVGTPITGRIHPATEDLIGFFVNMVVIRGRLGGDPTFAELLSRVRAICLEAYTHQDLPFERLVDELAPARDRSRHPLFDVLFTYEVSAPGPTCELPGVAVADFPACHVAAKFDLALGLREDGDQLTGVFEYSTDLFDAMTVEQMAGHLIRVLDRLTADPSLPLSRLDLLDAAERGRLLEQSGPEPTAVPNEPVHAVVGRHALATPDAVAVVGEHTTLSYRELDGRANRLAHHLRALGAGPDSVIGVCLDRSPDMVIALLGILKAGAAYLPLDPANPRDRLDYMINVSNAAAIVTVDSLVTVLPSGLATPLVILDRESRAITARPDATLDLPVHLDQLAYLFFTSGSTGAPKCVALPHQALTNLARAQQERFGLTSGDRALQFNAAGFDVSLSEVLSALTVGATLIVAPPEARIEPAALLGLLREQKVTAAQIPPAMLTALPDSPLPELATLLTGGEHVPATTVARWAPTRRFLIAYGVTEAGVTSTIARCEATDPAPLPIGTPLSGTRLFILDRHLAPAPAGGVGEIYIGGAGLARGYASRADLTADRFIPNPFARDGSRLYRTGDRARRRHDGALEFLGRVDAQVKLRGHRIEPAEVEAAVVSMAGVSGAAVTVHRNSGGDARLVTYLVAEHEPVDTAHLRDQLRALLPDHMIPATYMWLDALPVTPNGKLDRAALPSPVFQPRADYTPPRTELEERLTEIIADVLHIDRVGVHDNFFELGGDSIVSIQVVSRAREAGIGLTASQLFEFQTVAEMAAAERPVIAAEQGIVSGELPLTPIQRWFFELDRPDPHHFNQARAFSLEPTVTAEAAQAAGAALLAHHDALRLRFKRNGAQITQRMDGAEASHWFARVDAQGLSPEAERALVTAEAARAQLGLNLVRGPLLRMIYFDRGPRRPAYLAIFIHHLAVDAVSWGVLVEDLSLALTQLLAGQSVRLGAKTTSYRHWADRLMAEAAAPGTIAESGYWLDSSRALVNQLPVDRTGGDNREADACTIEVCLDDVETDELLRSVPTAYRTRITDVLIAALGRVVTGWTCGNRILVDVESHGRVELDGVDLSRTVGWFTAQCPALVENIPTDIDGLLRSVKEQLRAIPRTGLGYGLLRYVNDSDIARRLAALPKAQIGFNYLGRHDSTLEDDAGLLRPLNIDLGPLRSPGAIRPHLLEVNCRISENRFLAYWTYSPEVHEAATIETLANGFLDALRDILEHCRIGGAGRHTPSDFPLAELDQRALTALESRVAGSIDDIYPMSPMQQGMLFHTLLESGSVGVYVEQTVLTLSGPLDVSVLGRALDHVANHHPSLRSRVVWEDVPRPLTVVLDQVDVSLVHDDWSGIEESERESRLAAWLCEDRAEGVPVDHAPPLRAAVIRLDTATSYLVLTYHHLLMDGWSVPLFLDELFTTIRALSADRHPSLPKRRPYRDHIAWLLEQDRDAARGHWQLELAGVRTPTPLPAATPEPRHGYGHHRHLLTEDVSTALTLFARREHLTLSTVIQGAWALLMSGYTARDDVVFGTTVSGRGHALRGVDTMIGLFINTIPVRVRVARDDAVARWLGDLQDQQRRGRPYEHTSLVDIHEWSDLPAGEPLFESIVVFENYPAPPTAPGDASQATDADPGILTACVSVAVEQDNYPLTLFSSPGTRIPLGLAYDHSRYDDATIRQLTHHLAHILEQIAENPHRAVRRMTLLGETDHARPPSDTTSSCADLPPHAVRAVHELIADQARRRPGAAAVTAQDGEYTYDGLIRRANRLAYRLRRLGVDAETPVGVCLPAGRDLPAAMLAVWNAGGVYLPLDPAHPAERLRQMLATAHADVVITTSELSRRLPVDHAASLIQVDTDRELDSCPDLDLRLPTHRGQAAYLIYTSGSTGQPKGIAVAHGSLANLAHAQQRVLRIRPEDRVLQLTSAGFDVSVSEMLSALTVGADLVIPPTEARLDPGVLLDQLRHASIAAAQIPVTLLDLLPASELPDLSMLLTGGEPVSQTTVDRWSDTRRFLIAYGVTEATVTTTLARCRPGGSPTVGYPIAGNTVHILDADLRPLPLGAVGELFIGGIGVARGYAQRPDLTSERFIPDPFAANGSRLYRTGDLARFRRDGELEFLGRTDAQVKLRGVRIEPGEIEAALASAPCVRAAAVAVHIDASQEPQLVAHLVPDETDARPDAATLRNHAALLLPEHMVPSHYVWTQAFPLTANGKLDRAALPKPDLAPGTEYAPPRTPTERILADIYAEVLELDRVGIDDHFLHLGGHSLLVTRAVTRVRAAFDIDLPIAAIFDHPTVAALAKAVEDILVTKIEQMPEDEIRRRLGLAGQTP